MKGGVGKTTTAVHLAAGLAARGRRVLLVDTDPQGHVALALGVTSEQSISDVLLTDRPVDTMIVRGAREGLDVIVATPAAFTLETQLAGRLQRETILARRLRPLTSYDAIVLDGSPAMSLLTYNALLCADEVIIPVGMDRMAVMGAHHTLQGIREIRQVWPEHPLALLAVLPTAVSSTTHAARATLGALRQDPEMEERLLARGVGQCIDLTYAMARQQTIWEYAPRSRGAQDYTALVDFVGESDHGQAQEA